MTARLVFVYNANSGLIAGVLDSVHKTLSPDTYACDLCALTHGLVTMRPQWRQWLRQLPIEADFYHRTDFQLAYPEWANQPLPLVGMVEEGLLTILLDADALANFSAVEELFMALEAKLRAFNSV